MNITSIPIQLENPLHKGAIDLLENNNMANGYQFFYPQQTASPAPPALSAKRSRGSRRSPAAAC